MPRLIAAAIALTLAVPAFAQDAPADEAEFARSLPAPQEVEAMGDALGRVADAILDVEIGPIVEAVDPGRRMNRDTRERTLGDVASRDDPHARERLRGSIQASAAGLGAMIAQLAILAPVLRRSFEDAERRIDDAMEGYPPARD